MSSVRTQKTMKPATLLMLTVLVLATAFISMSNDLEAVAPIPPDFSAKVPPSLEELAFDADAIVLATLQFIKTDIRFYLSNREVPGKRFYNGGSLNPYALESTERYLPIQVLGFQVHEYLKGAGPSQVFVEVRHYPYGESPFQFSELINDFPNMDGALEYAIKTMSDPNDSWDDRSGVLFLREPNEWGNHEFYLTVNERSQQVNPNELASLNRAWLLAARHSVGSEQYVTEGSQFPRFSVSIEELRTSIDEMEREMGSPIPGYAACVKRQIHDEREDRGYLKEGKVRPPRVSIDVEISSGQPAGAIVYDPQSDSIPSNASGGDLPLNWSRYWLDGPDKDLFSFSGIEQPTPDKKYFAEDTLTVITTRPLPQGSYRFNYYDQYVSNMSCDYVSPNDFSAWTIDVVASPDSAHEAFFDPTESGIGEVLPDSLSIDNETTEIQSLHWMDSSMVLSLNPHVPLQGYTLELIALDGSVLLALPVADADIREDSGTFTWNIPDKPWKGRDKLMLRIRRDE